jgi:hypothetical protein
MSMSRMGLGLLSPETIYKSTDLVDRNVESLLPEKIAGEVFVEHSICESERKDVVFTLGRWRDTSCSLDEDRVLK